VGVAPRRVLSSSLFVLSLNYVPRAMPSGLLITLSRVHLRCRDASDPPGCDAQDWADRPSPSPRPLIR